MIIGIGIDSIEIDRFQHWATFNEAKLQRIYSPEEISYCLGNPHKSAERFAARFAAREAFFKAYHDIAHNNPVPFLTVCKNLIIKKTAQGSCQLAVNWKALLANKAPAIESFLSITHTKTMATAQVILETA